MTFSKIVEHLPAHVANKGSDFAEFEIRHVVAGDLMSDVLVAEYDDLLMVSSLNSEQVLRTANMVGARGILLVNDKVPSDSMKTLAEAEDITVLSTPLSLFEACISLGHLLGRSGAAALK